MSAPVPTWQECFDAGMTARQAAEARGMGLSAAYQWAQRRNLSWPCDYQRAGFYKWRGKTYRGLHSVAKAAGVTFSAVSRHLERNGNLDTLGMGPRGGDRLGPNAPGKPVEKFGKSWPSIAAVARDSGRNRTTIKWWLERGDDQSLLAALMAAEARKAAAAMREAEMMHRQARKAA